MNKQTVSTEQRWSLIAASVALFTLLAFVTLMAVFAPRLDRDRESTLETRSSETLAVEVSEKGDSNPEGPEVERPDVPAPVNIVVPATPKADDHPKIAAVESRPRPPADVSPRNAVPSLKSYSVQRPPDVSRPLGPIQFRAATPEDLRAAGGFIPDGTGVIVLDAAPEWRDAGMRRNDIIFATCDGRLLSPAQAEAEVRRLQDTNAPGCLSVWGRTGGQRDLGFHALR